MRAELIHKRYPRIKIEVDVSETIDDDKICEIEINRQRLPIPPSSEIGNLIPHNKEKNSVNINDFTIIYDDEEFFPEGDIHLYFYKDRIEILDSLILTPEEDINNSS